MTRTIGDLVEVPQVKTVIQVADSRQPGGGLKLVQSFVLTGEAELAVTSFLSAIASGEGKGFFLRGHYGSGKSHLLGVLNAVLTDPAARRQLACAAGEGSACGRALAALGDRRFLVVAVSLVEHSNREYLEEIVLRETAAALATAGPSASPGGDLVRKDAFDAIGSEIARLGLDGLVLLLDELSEFLRSKPDGRAFNEDIRFLQFLGEYAPRLPLWILATIQENIEDTGDIAPEAFNKIKDRYPFRLRLTGQHIKEIVARRLAIKVPGADPAIEELYAGLRRKFRDLSFSQAEFADLYPVHPRTVTVLDDLRQLFSQHRGVVDFIYTRLVGDQRRGLPGLLDAPADQLLLPDMAFDHFRDRIHEMPETHPYSEQVYRVWESEVPSLTADGEEADLALKLIKNLILAAISPGRRGLAVRELTERTTYAVSSLEPAANYEYIADLLDRLYKSGSYLAREAGPSRLDDVYRIDLEADVSLSVRRRMEYIKKGLFPDDRRVFTRLADWVDEPFLPLAGWLAAPRGKRTVTWQKTRREGMLIFGSLTEVSPEAMRGLAAELDTTELDFALLIAEPLDPDGQERHLCKLAATPPGAGLAFWLPRRPSDLAALRDALAFRLLFDEAEAGEGERVREYLKALLPDHVLRVKEQYREAYLGGRIVFWDGEEWELRDIGLLPFESLLEKVAGHILAKRFPRHLDVAPTTTLVTPALFQRVIDEFLAGGELTPEGRADSGVKLAVEGILTPLGLVRRSVKGYRLAPDPAASPVVADFLERAGPGEAGLDGIYLELRKGPFGLSRDSFGFLLAGLICGGLVSAFSRGRRMPVEQLSAANLWKIDAVSKGELLPAELHGLLLGAPLIPARLKKEALTVASQQAIWDFLVQWKRQAEEALPALRARLAGLEGYAALAALDFEATYAQIARLLEVAGEIKVSYSPAEGLQRFLAAYRAQPYFEKYRARLERLAEFMDSGLDQLVFVHRYLTSPELDLPDRQRYAGLRQRRSALLELLKDEAVLVDKEFYQRLADEFAAFQRMYGDAYLEEHRAARSAELLLPYEAVRESGPYRVLAALSNIKLISVRDDLVRVDRQLAQALAARCDGADPALLRTRPACGCGFRLGETVALPPLAGIVDSIDRGIRQYVEALRAPACAEKIRAYAAGMEQVGQGKAAAPARELLALDPGAADVCGRAEGLINRNVIAIINEALAGQALIFDRDVDDLYESLVDRTFSLDQVRRIFEDWLRGQNQAGQSGDGGYIRVTGRRGTLPLAVAPGQRIGLGE